MTGRCPDTTIRVAVLDQKQIDFYHNEGYLGVPDVLSADEVEELRRTTDEFVANSREVSEHDDVYDLEPGHTADEPRVRRIKMPHLQHPSYDRAMRHPKIVQIADQLIGPGIRSRGTKLNMKSAGFGSPVEWHQDWAFYPHTNDDVLAVGIAIDELNEENGGLLVVPGSHTGPIHDHHENGYFVGAVTDTEIDPADSVRIDVPAGGITIHHVRTLHGSAPNRSGSPRRLMLIEICANDAWPLVDYKGLDDMETHLLSGSVTITPRLKDVPVRMPHPSYEGMSSIYDLQTKLEDRVLARQG